MVDEEHRSRADVRRTYERIGEHFSQTREYPWPEVEAFVEGSRPTVALDLGCGNGRHAALLAGHAETVLAFDASRTLLLEARQRTADTSGSVALLQGDAAGLPIRPGTVDLAVYVATLHHLPTADARRRSLDELARVLAPDGRALVSAWSTAHDRFDADADATEGFDTTLDWTLPDGTVVERFYHIYSPAEFEAAICRSNLDLIEFEVSSGNCYATVGVERKHP
ncbi:MAG: class I SAM-dependent methyltransferase [Haloarculaceae archaeon]